MEKIPVKSFGEHPKQDEVLSSNARFKVLSCGRRFGKGNGVLRAIGTDALHNPGSVFWIVSPNFSYTAPMWDKALLAFGGVRIGGQKFIRSTRIKDRALVLFNNSRIEFKSAIEPNTLRGAGELMLGVAFDEAAYCDPESWKAVRPALMDNQAWAYFISTPSSIQPKNWFYDLFIQGVAKVKSVCNECLGSGCDVCGDLGYSLIDNKEKHPSYQSWQFSSYDNPYIKDEEIDAMIKEFGWSDLDVLREVYGEFVGGDAVVFNYESVMDCSKGQKEPGMPGKTYFIAIDLGRVGSYTVITVIRAPDEPGDVPRVVNINRFRGSWEMQKARILDMVNSYGQPVTYLDATGIGDTMEGELRNSGIRHLYPVKLTGINKPQMINALIAAVDGASITWYPHKQLESELLNFEASVTQSGNVIYRKPKGSNQFDDCVMSLAMAWWAYLKHGSPQKATVWAVGVG